jgi:phosphonate transport system substrate-binding protein
LLPWSAGLVHAQPRSGLVLAFIPQENPEKLLGDVKVISHWLGKQIGVPVRGFVTSDHAAPQPFGGSGNQGDLSS